MTNTQEAFDRWCKDVGKNVYMKLAPKDICSEAWKACQAHNDAVIAELVEALEQCNLCISSAVRIESNSFDEPPTPVSEWDYHADMLSIEITMLIAKHKKGTA